MPVLTIWTNVSLEGVDVSSILTEATSTVANLTGIVESYVMIVLKGSVPMSFGGIYKEPAASGELSCLGALNPEVNKKLSATISSILDTKLSVPKSRFYLKFNDLQASNVGWNGTTFAG